MTVVNSKKPTTATTAPSNWAGAAARIRRSGSSRLGRRSALLGVLTSMYANSSRGASATATNGSPSPSRPTAAQNADRS